MTYDPVFFGDDNDDWPRQPGLICTECDGTGIAVEGWPCEECDGYGDFEFGLHPVRGQATMNKAQREAVKSEISYEEDYIARLKLESQAAGLTADIQEAILRHTERLAQLREGIKRCGTTRRTRWEGGE